MSCTTVLVGKNASNDRSTMIARTDDGHFDEKKLVVVEPSKQPKKYKCVISHLEIDLPDQPMRYTACPSVDEKNGIWAATGINAANVGMTATETITSNPACWRRTRWWNTGRRKADGRRMSPAASGKRTSSC